MTAPAGFAVSAEKVSLSPLILSAGAAERLEIAADLALKPLSGQLRAQWNGLNLSRANAYLQDVQITGKSRGSVKIGLLSGNRLTLAESASSNGTFARQGGSMTIRSSRVTFDGGTQGMGAGIELSTADGGSVKGNFSSSAPLSLAMPEKGKLTAEVNGIDLALLKPWLPPDTVLEGRISGHATGSMLPGQRFELDGTASISGGKVHQQRPDGELNLTFKSATTSWNWRGETLSGTLSLAMAEYGQARGNFQLPLPARFPLAVNPKGPVRASLSGQVTEKGIITALFPGLVQESYGELSTELDISGT
jgi:translocation and assembly module TamB